MGPMTGRAAGYCAGYPVPGYMNPVGGRGLGRGAWGGGRGWRNRFWATGLPGWARAGYGPAAPWWTGATYQPDPQQEKVFLEDQVKLLEGQLQAIQERLAALADEQAKTE